MSNKKYEVRYVDLTEDEPKQITERVNNEKELNNLLEYEDVGLISVIDYRTIENCKDCICSKCERYLPNGINDCHICNCCTNEDLKRNKAECFTKL